MKSLRRRQYDQAIIEKTKGLVLGPYTALCRPYMKLCTRTNKAVGTIWRGLSKPPQRWQGPDPPLLWLLVVTLSSWTWARVETVCSTAYSNGYFWHTIILTYSYMFVYYIFVFDYTAFAVSGKVGYPLSGLTTPVGWLLWRHLTVRSRYSNWPPGCCYSNWPSAIDV